MNKLHSDLQNASSPTPGSMPWSRATDDDYAALLMIVSSQAIALQARCEPERGGGLFTL